MSESQPNKPDSYTALPGTIQKNASPPLPVENASKAPGKTSQTPEKVLPTPENIAPAAQNFSALPYPYANVSTQKPKAYGNYSIEMQEFVSFSCAVCYRGRGTVDKALLRHKGELALRLRHFPLPQTPLAYDAAQAFECAADGGKEWEMEPMLYAAPANYTKEGLGRMASSAGLNLSLFNWCMESGAKKSVVDADLAEVKKRGMRGTPYFVIGNSTIPSMMEEEDFLPEVYRGVKSTLSGQ